VCENCSEQGTSGEAEQAGHHNPKA